MTIRKFIQVNCVCFDTSYALRRGSSLIYFLIRFPIIIKNEGSYSKRTQIRIK